MTAELDQGVSLHRGESVPGFSVDPIPPPEPRCPDDKIDPDPEASIARRWNEQILNAIRRDIPRPTVHARNLFHLSAAVWDAWAAYDDRADGYVVRERQTVDDVAQARDEAISYAAYRVLSHRYAPAVGGKVSQACFDAFMERLGYDPADDSHVGDGPRALGNRIGFAVIDAFANDGANESENYADSEGFCPIPRTSSSIGPAPARTLRRFGSVSSSPRPRRRTGFLPRRAHRATSAVTGEPSRHFLSCARPRTSRTSISGRRRSSSTIRSSRPQFDCVRRSSEIDTTDATLIDISPGAFGNNPLGTNDGTGRSENPVTGEPYEPELVLRADFGRTLAEFSGRRADLGDAAGALEHRCERTSPNTPTSSAASSARATISRRCRGMSRLSR